MNYYCNYYIITTCTKVVFSHPLKNSTFGKKTWLIRNADDVSVVTTACVSIFEPVLIVRRERVTYCLVTVIPNKVFENKVELNCTYQYYIYLTISCP